MNHTLRRLLMLLLLTFFKISNSSMDFKALKAL
jgi:hypothetical protein